MPKTFAIINLGCPKNTVDSEGMLQRLAEAGYVATDGLHQADAIIVNTCGFIDTAKEESIKTLLELAAMKRNGQLLIAAGCLGERYAADLARDIPELDGILGTRRWGEITTLLDRVAEGETPCWTGKSAADESFKRTARSASVYIKIADGCSVGCAFCAIPRIKGPHRSKAVEDILDEARQLASQGVKEIVLVAQNTTAYGQDRGERDGLARLLDRLSEAVPEIPWIRLMYTFPDHITPALIEAMASNDRIVKYIDIPLQHADPAMLQAMRRPDAYPGHLISQLRRRIPVIAIRSAFIVGYPGEGEQEFSRLLSFLREAELDRVGVFTYSPEEGTLAASLPGHVGKRIAQKRYRQAMEAQQAISLKKNRRFIGKTLDVLIESQVNETALGDQTKPTYGAQQPVENGRRGSASAKRRHENEDIVFVGRSYRDAPEVDGVVLVHGRATIGEIVSVTITDALEYDLVGRVAG
ncbi:MAG: 30S ribosomal protein S12 methylthiotransferase RimO [Chloroflexi bacterium]|nr:30S ribosomal protein S12 methylthiotransferase RimO [Chloroflexota bacterium]